MAKVIYMSQTIQFIANKDAAEAEKIIKLIKRIGETKTGIRYLIIE